MIENCVVFCGTYTCIFSVLQSLVGKYFNKVDNFCILLYYALRNKSVETVYNSDQFGNSRYSILSDVNETDEVVTTQSQDEPTNRKKICIDDDNEVTIVAQGHDGSSSSKDKCIHSKNTQLNQNKRPPSSKTNLNQEQHNKDGSKADRARNWIVIYRASKKKLMPFKFKLAANFITEL